MSDARGLMFSTVSTSGTPATKFDLSHEHKTTLNGGSIIPILFQECLPGEIHDLDVRSFIRLMPMTFPIFQRIDLYVHSFFVPNRILWSGWNEFIWNGNGKVKMTDQSSWTPPVKPFFTNADLFQLVYWACHYHNSSSSPSTPYAGLVQASATASLLTAYVLTGDKRFLTNRFFGQNWTKLTDPVYSSFGQSDIIKFLSALLKIEVPSLSSLPVYLGLQTSINEYALGRYVYNAPSFTNDGTAYGSKMSQFNKIGHDLASIAPESTDLSVWLGVITGATSLQRYVTQVTADINRSDAFDYSTILTGSVKNVGETALTEEGFDAAMLAYSQILATDSSRYDLLPFRAYLSVYNEYYRDENIDSYIDVPLVSGHVEGASEDNWSTHFLRHMLFTKPRAWQHDYFTSCFTKQSRQNVLIPVDLKLDTFDSVGDPGSFTLSSGSNTSVGSSSGDILFSQGSSIKGSLSARSTSLMDDLRTALHLQRMWDKMTRAGSRVRESLRNFFGNAKAQDLSPDEPVYLGGSSIPITISEVTQTSASDANSALGDMAGHGTASGSSDHIHLETAEHGFFVVFVSIRPRSGYSQGLSKMFQRWTYLDYAWPDLATLGEQKVSESEIFNQPLHGNDNTFGYIPRYSEYKYLNDRLSGDFKNPSFDDWHLSRLFNRTPLLNSEFVHVGSSEVDRVFAYEDHDFDHFVGAFYLDYQAVRPLPMYSDPTF